MSDQIAEARANGGRRARVRRGLHGVGVEVNVIRGWLGHVKIETTNRYAEINRRTKEAALLACDAPLVTAALPRKPSWRNDKAFLKWLDSL